MLEKIRLTAYSTILEIENNLIDAIVVLPKDTFYSTDISVTLWVLSKNKKERTVNLNGKVKKYRNRENEVLFMDLRQWGVPFEKLFIEFTAEEITKVSENYHNWQQTDYKTTYKNVPEYCYSATIEEIKNNDFALVPSRYIEFVDRDSEIDFQKEMSRIQKDFKILMNDERKSQEELIKAFKILGYEI
jgi:type I restriction enzyme M protein